jgi:D-glycero-alpha-D-manno-heptose 1-phosphate guanylyltransferase
MKNKPIIILAGGFGTRLKSYLDGRPKPMVDVNGKPFLEYILKNLLENGFNNFIFSLHYKSELIIEYLNLIKHDILINCNVQYYVEETPLGTGGAVSYIISQANIKDDFYVLNADTWIKDKLFELKELDTNLIALIEVENSDRYGKVQMNSESIITNFIEKGTGLGKGLINAGFYKFNKRVFESIDKTSYSLENDFFPILIKRKELRGFILNTEFIDIGVPVDYLRFCELNRI